MKKSFFFFLMAFVTLASASEDKAVISARLQKWAHDFNNKRIKETCDLFAPDLIASYPGNVDKNFKMMCDKLTSALLETSKSFHYEEPKIEQIIVEGDLAAVKLVWTLTIKEGSTSSVIKEKGLDIFRRQKDGKWKIAISYAYPE